MAIWHGMSSFGAYKFVEPEHIPNLMSGHIRLGSLEHYQDVERPEIRDEMEGAQKYFQSRTVVVDPNTEDGRQLQRKLAEVRVVAGPGTTFENCTFENRLTSLHVFCYSVGPLAELTKHWFDYHGCVEIVDQELLARSIFDNGILYSGPLVMPVKQAFRRIERGSVIYDAGPRDIVTEEPVAVSPLRKERRFAEDREVRLVFENNEIELPKIVYVTIPNPTDVFRMLIS